VVLRVTKGYEGEAEKRFTLGQIVVAKFGPREI
jgi:hypothetical protein